MSAGEGRLPKEKVRDRSALLEILDVDINGGTIKWRRRPKDKSPQWNGQYAGKIAGGRNSQGYWTVNINGTHHRAHHIIWTVAHGQWPSLDIDHIDGDRTNNAISNLREATRSENLKNKGVSDPERLGLAGVDKNGTRWRARVSVDGRQIELGTFSEIKDAIAARRKAEREYGYHPNHGRRLAYGPR